MIRPNPQEALAYVPMYICSLCRKLYPVIAGGLWKRDLRQESLESALLGVVLTYIIHTQVMADAILPAFGIFARSLL